METIELFSGTKSFSKGAKKRGFNTLTIDNVSGLNPDICVDIMHIHPNYFPHFNILWASPPCKTFSVASIGCHWKKVGKDSFPKTKEAEKGLLMLEKTVSLIASMKPDYWFIENPRGLMRKFLDKMLAEKGISSFRRVTVTYCQYGD